MQNPELDRAVWAVVKAVNQLMKDGILTLDENGFILTPEGEAWVAIRNNYRESKRRSIKRV